MEPSSPRSYLASRPTSRWLVTKTSWKVVKESLVRLIPAATDLVEFVGQPLEQSCSEEAFDAGLFCRGLFAECKGFEVLKGDASYVGEVPLGLVSDAKDVFDKSVSDTPTYGSQKSLAFSVAWIREVLRKDRTRIHWTSTENMLIDCGAKEMNPQHLKAVLSKGSWSITYNPSYVKQTTKPAKPKLAHEQSSTLPGRVLSGDDPILSHLLKLAERPGWPYRDRTGSMFARMLGHLGPLLRDSQKNSTPFAPPMEGSTLSVKLTGESWKTESHIMAS